MNDNEILIDQPGSAHWSEILAVLRVLNEQQYLALVAPEKLDQEKSKILSRAAADAEVIRGEALASGIRSGMEEVSREWEKTVAQWKTAVDEHRSACRDAIRKQAELVLESASALAEWILRRELGDPAALRRHLAGILSDQPDEACVVIHVSPRQLAAVEEARKSVEALRASRVEADKTLEEGDLRLEYRRHQADFRIRTMLDRGAAVLLQQLRKGEL